MTNNANRNMYSLGLFSGVGGIELGFEQAGFENIWSNEIDAKASLTFGANFLNKLIMSDVRSIPASDIPDHDVLLAGFPCQAFSLAGHRKGFDDDRGNLFFEICRILKEKRPGVVFLENVKNLVSHDRGKTFQVILKSLKDLGYYVKYKTLNAMEYGNIPQNRERIYIIGFQDKQRFERFTFPDPIPLTKGIQDIVDFNAKVSDKYYYKKSKTKIYDTLEEAIINPRSIYQWRRVYVRENKSGVCPTLTANMGTGGHNVPIVLTKFGIRKLTPKECFLFQGFPKDFVLPSNISNTSLYKQAGNSVVVPVIKRIAQNIQ